MNDFLQHVKKNAKDSLKIESGCLRFDVLLPREGSKSIFLYEIYESKKAFKHHLTTKHFKNFDRSVRKLVALKTVREFFLPKDLQ